MAKILILGVNPFEDLPGFQLLGLLRAAGRTVIGADDSQAAAAALGDWGAEVRPVPHPSEGFVAYAEAVSSLVETERIGLIIAGSDAHLAGLASPAARGHGLPKLLGPGAPMLEAPFNKDSIHGALASVLDVPRTMAFDRAEDVDSWRESRGGYPVMVKGKLKGAIECVDEIEAHGAYRTILKNPANRCEGGGVLFQEHVAGTEHATVVFKSPTGAGAAGYIGVRKLARTQLGTTLCARTENGLDHEMIANMASRLDGFPSVFEIEWRRRPNGSIVVFEANLRFPSWISALGDNATNLLETWVDYALLQETMPPSAISIAPGQLLYRLPAGGTVPLNQVFSFDGSTAGLESEPTAQPPPPSEISVGSRAKGSALMEPLWKSSSPHQFLVK